jgi:hypothetical protein
MSENKREPGYYRVNYEGFWIIREWNTGTMSWALTCFHNGHDDDFLEIDETLISAEPTNPKPTRDGLIEKAEQFLVGKYLMEYLPELMADFHIEMGRIINNVQ